MDISSALHNWYTIHKRDLPWRHTTSPYLIWLSEVIMQQTRVDQGTEYYVRFAARFPKVEDLAAASSGEVMRLWQGLGYYSRARNLHETARYIVTALNGVFPDTYIGLLQLRGVGKYTAAAVASLAFGEPVAVVDGNVLRVVSRIFGIELPVDSTAGKEECARIAQSLITTYRPDIHNQAVMELGALVCLPRNPACGHCPVAPVCVALKKGIADQLPVKSRKKAIRKRYLHYFFIENEGYTWLRKRVGKDIWHSLYEFPLLETPRPETPETLFSTNDWKNLFGVVPFSISRRFTYQHQLTHQTLHAAFYQMDPGLYKGTLAGYQQVKITDLGHYALPRLIVRFLDDLGVERT